MLQVTNPRTGAPLYELQEPDEPTLARIYDAARTSFAEMRALTLPQRLACLRRIKQHILAQREQVINRIVSETGKPRFEALLTEIFPTLDLIQYYEKHAPRILRPEKQPTPLILFGKKSRVYYEPLGPCLIISPWNYPFNLSMTPIVTALAAGNSVIFKPSEYTPLRGLLEEIFAASGLPENAVQVVYGGKGTGQRLVDLQPAKIFFTGSEAAGKAIMAQAAKHLTPVELELGGKDPMVVFADVNLERAVSGALWGAMTNSGQTCTSVERIYVEQPLYLRFVEALKQRIERLTPCDDEKEGDLGWMTANFQIEKVEAQIRDAREKGAEIICGGCRNGEALRIPPTLVAGVTPVMDLYAQETFGPLATITPFTTEGEAVQLANDSPYGLSASVWTADPDRAERIARAIHTGNVSINNVLATQANSALPFGGVKNSGIGRYKGAHGLYAFSNIKSVMTDKNSARAEAIWYPYTPEKYTLLDKLITHLFQPGPVNLIKAILTGLRLDKTARR